VSRLRIKVHPHPNSKFEAGHLFDTQVR